MKLQRTFKTIPMLLEVGLVAVVTSEHTAHSGHTFKVVGEVGEKKPGREARHSIRRYAESYPRYGRELEMSTTDSSR